MNCSIYIKFYPSKQSLLRSVISNLNSPLPNISHYLWNFSWISLSLGFVMWVYTWVVVIEACPRSSWMARISAPLVNNVVAKLCLSVWAETSFIIFARSAYSLILFVIKKRVSRTSSLESGFFITSFQWTNFE